MKQGSNKMRGFHAPTALILVLASAILLTAVTAGIAALFTIIGTL